MIFKKTDACNNPYGYKEIEIIKFNYDGDGSAIVKEEGLLSSYGIVDINIIMFGDEAGTKLYELFS